MTNYRKANLKEIFICIAVFLAIMAMWILGMFYHTVRLYDYVDFTNKLEVERKFYYILTHSAEIKATGKGLWHRFWFSTDVYEIGGICAFSYFFVGFFLMLTFVLRLLAAIFDDKKSGARLKISSCVFSFVPLVTDLYLYRVTPWVWDKGSLVFLLSACVGIFGYFILTINNYYTEEAPVSFWGKIVEIPIQILMLVISVVVQFIMIIPVIGLTVGFLCSDSWIRDLLYVKIKDEELDEGESYNVGASDTLVTETVKHEIKTQSGETIGTFTTKESHIEHDNGNRYDDSSQEIMARWHIFFILPFRIFTFAMSVLALFIPKLYVKVKKPETDADFSHKLFCMFDLIIYNRTTFPKREG